MENTPLPGRPERNEEEPGKIQRNVCEIPQREGTLCGRGSAWTCDLACGEGLSWLWALSLSLPVKIRRGRKAQEEVNLSRSGWGGGRAGRPSWLLPSGRKCTN